MLLEISSYYVLFYELIFLLSHSIISKCNKLHKYGIGYHGEYILFRDYTELCVLHLKLRVLVVLFRERDLLGLGAQFLLGGGHPEGDRVVFPFDRKLHSRQGFLQ